MSGTDPLRDLSPGRVAGVVGALGAAAAVGAAVGVAAERMLVRRALRPDPERDEPFGGLRGRVVPVIATDGTPLHVEVEEPPEGSLADRLGDGLTIVFSHGYALEEDSWHYQRRDLRALGRLVLWDQRSHGRSGRGSAENATIDQLGRDLESVIAAAAPTGPLVLIGHSMGGMTVMSYAAHHPEMFGDRVRGVGLIATSSGGLAEVPLGLPAPLAKAFHNVAPQVAGVLARRKDLVERGRRAGSDVAYLLTKVYSFGSNVPPSLTQFVHRMLSATPIDVVAEFLPTLEAHDKKTALDAIGRVDTLVLVGASDLLTPSAHSDEIVRHVPGAELVLIPDSGHMVMLEKYPEVNQHIRELVGRVRAGLAHTEETA
ncbi:alpha/beta fold hydrolase [Longivirga aurantiaca]|uniref:Alpha/beta fold hydrolase n=1 Tax=Longivirga aurantiaca TaxID=1837743 RepID=A0ABW1SZH5_9ACTN